MQGLGHITGQPGGDTEYFVAPREEFPIALAFREERMLVRVYHHHLNYPDEEVHCWTYVTDGMWQHNQPDVVLSVQCLPDEMAGDSFRVPKRPVIFLHTLCKLAMQGQPVGLGGYTELGEAGMLVGDFKGAIYVAPEYYRGVTLPNLGALSAVLVYEEELAVVKRGGLTRIAAMLGKEKRYFPVARWADRHRPPLPLMHETLAKSVHLNTPTAFVRASAVLQDNVVTLQLPRLPRNQFARLNDLPPNTPFTLALQTDPVANACLVWLPDGNPTTSIVRDGPPVVRTSGTYMGFGPDDSGIRVLGVAEDGFLVRADTATVMSIREALVNGTRLTVDGFDVFPELHVEWFDPSFVQVPYPRPMLQPTPEDLDRPDILPGTTLISEPLVVLYAPPDDVTVSIGIDPLKQFLRQIDRTLFDVIAPLPDGTDADLAIYMKVYADGQFAVMVSVRTATRETTEALQPHVAQLGQRLEKLPGPPLRGKQPITFAYIIGVGAGSGKPMFTVF